MFLFGDPILRLTEYKTPEKKVHALSTTQKKKKDANKPKIKTVLVALDQLRNKKKFRATGHDLDGNTIVKQPSRLLTLQMLTLRSPGRWCKPMIMSR